MIKIFYLKKKNVLTWIRAKDQGMGGCETGEHVSPPGPLLSLPGMVRFPTPISQLGRNWLDGKGRCFHADILRASWPTALQIIWLWKGTCSLIVPPDTPIVSSPGACTGSILLAVFLTLFQESQSLSHPSGPTGSTCWEHRRLWYCPIHGLDRKQNCWLYLLVPMDGIGYLEIPENHLGNTE